MNGNISDNVSDRDLNTLLDETIDDDVAHPLRLSFFWWTSAFVLIGLIYSWHDKNATQLFCLSLLIFMISGLLHFLVFCHEEQAVRRLAVRIRYLKVSQAEERDGSPRKLDVYDEHQIPSC